MTPPAGTRPIYPAPAWRTLASAIAALLCLPCGSWAQEPGAPAPQPAEVAPAPAPAPEPAPAPPAEEPPVPAADEVTLEVVTFHQDTGKLYVTMEEVADVLAWPVMCDWKNRDLLVNAVPIPKTERRRFTSGTELLSMEALTRAGAEVNIHPSGQSASIRAGDGHFTLMRAEKRVEVSIGEQRLRAWQGSRLVLETKVSTGRKGNTTPGNFSAGPYRSRLHRSKLYNGAAMPWSVQINGHIFIHGFGYVPDYPASHGCVRMPLDRGNPARFFYEWVDAGTPVAVLPAPKKEKKAKLTKK